MNRFEQAKARLSNDYKIVEAEYDARNLSLEDPVLLALIQEGAQIKKHYKHVEKEKIYYHKAEQGPLISTEEFFVVIGKPFITFDRDGMRWEAYEKSKVVGTFCIREFGPKGT